MQNNRRPPSARAQTENDDYSNNDTALLLDEYGVDAATRLGWCNTRSAILTPREPTGHKPMLAADVDGDDDGDDE